jgi:hypothetical protein
MSKLARNLTLLILFSVGGCTQTTRFAAVDPAQEYLQRVDTVTSSAGNAKEVNTRIHEIDPWPRYVGDTRIPGNGERMAGAVERYRDISKQSRGPRPLPSVGADSGSTSPSTTSTSANGSGTPPSAGQ